MNKHPVLNHILSFVKTEHIDEYIKKYKKLGFNVSPTAVRHAPGKKNRFVHFGPDYIELLWIEDKKEFEMKANSYEKYLQKLPNPYGIALKHNNLKQLREKLTTKDVFLPSVSQKKMIGRESEGPWWEFLMVGGKYHPGVFVFYITYLKYTTQMVKEVLVPQNGIYALCGVSFVTKYTQKRIAFWEKLLNSKHVTRNNISVTIKTATHFYTWYTANQFLKTFSFKFDDLSKAGSRKNEIALLHFYSKDLNKTKIFLEKRGATTNMNNSGLIFQVSKNDGYIFHVTEKPIKEWAKERSKHDTKIKIV